MIAPVTPQLVVNDAALKLQQKRFETALPQLQRYIESTVVPQSQARADNTINKEPGAHVVPTRWQTEKQRRWWFAVGVKTWHGRTGRVRAWRIVHRPTTDGGTITAENKTPYASFVFKPPDQQRMHVLTWMQSPVWAEQEREMLAPDVADAWAAYARKVT